MDSLMNKNVLLDKILNLICVLVCDLFDIHINTEQYRFFASTLFPNITLATLCGYHTNRWKHYLGLKHRASFIEQQLSEEYISTAQMNALRNINFLATATPVQSIIIYALRNIVVDRLTGSHRGYSTTLLDIVNTLRSHP
jgi:hypothetical protein